MWMLDFYWNLANKKTNQSLRFQIGIGASSHITLEIEQLISHMKTTIVYTVTILQGSDGEVIPISEDHDLLSKVNDILYKAVFMQVVNAPHIIVFLFSLTDSQEKGHGDSIPDDFSLLLYQYLYQLCRLTLFHNFRSMEEYHFL